MTLHPAGCLREFAGYYGLIREFIGLSEDEWMDRLAKGCTNIGRNLNDTRGLLHSFRDCRETMIALFRDLQGMLGESCLDWEIAFELRLRRSRYVRIYADVPVITKDRVFALEFKLKNVIDPDEVLQAAKYCPYLWIMFGPGYEIVPVLVLTTASDLFEFVPIGCLINHIEEG